MPAQPVELSPDGSCPTHRIARLAAKSKITRPQRAAQPVGETESIGSLRERNAARGPGDIPDGMLSAPFVRNVRANFSTEDVEIELQIGAALVQPRKIDRERLKIDAARQRHAAEGQTIFLPLRRAT